MTSIISEIFKDIEFSKDEIQYLSDKLQKKTLKKKEFLLKANQEVNDIHYIHSGCLRTYFIDDTSSS